MLSSALFVKREQLKSVPFQMVGCLSILMVLFRSAVLQTSSSRCLPSFLLAFLLKECPICDKAEEAVYIWGSQLILDLEFDLNRLGQRWVGTGIPCSVRLFMGCPIVGAAATFPVPD